MAKSNNYPSYLPEDFRGLESIQEGNQRYYYKRSEDGKTNLLYGAIIGSRHMIIRYPEGGTITPGIPVPANTVNSESIINGAVEMEDLNDDVKNKMTHSYDPSGEGIVLGGIATNSSQEAGSDTGADDGSDDI